MRQLWRRLSLEVGDLRAGVVADYEARLAQAHLEEHAGIVQDLCKINE